MRIQTFRVIFCLAALFLCVSIAPPPAPNTPDAFPSPSIVVPPLDDAPFGLNTHLATRYPDPSSMSVPADVVKNAGVGWAREDIHWFRVQPKPGAFDWTFTDAAFRELIRRNIQIVGVLGHPPGWATPYAGDAPSQPSFYAPDTQLFVDYAQAVVKRYGRYVHHWEIWNEPDNPIFWQPAPDPAAYATMLKATSSAIRSIDPAAKILLGGINPFDTRFLERIGQDGAWDSFDILAIHPYVDPMRPEAAGIGAAADSVRTIAARYGQKPLWVTEIGWASGRSDHDKTGAGNEQQQADNLVRAMVLLWRAGIERIFWYTLKDDPGNPYGLVAYGDGRADYTHLKPAYYALGTLNHELSNATFVGMRDLFKRTNVFDFERADGWRTSVQPNGMLSSTTELQHAGAQAAQLDYSFATTGNDYVVFTRERPLLIPNQSYALGMWVYGDGSGHTMKVWLRDAEGEILQYALGTVGPAGWRLLQVPIGGTVPEWNRITKDGNGQLDFPAAVYALVLDDAPDRSVGSGTIYVDDLTAISGPEAYDLQVERNGEAVDVLWAPDGLRARLPTYSALGLIADTAGNEQTLQSSNNYFSLNLGPAPMYVHHQRTARSYSAP
ncbi:MAG TPA: flagellar filament outer layer protein FlaA [Roseiflexaceae bacterium]|nr:flagellar filament outer layer protein FlaA [Roseiflexaceae bacterium]